MLPKEYGSGFTCHRRFQEWNQTKRIQKGIWIKLLKIYDDLVGINWTWWQSIDSISIKSPLVGGDEGNNPTDRSKVGRQKDIF